MHNIKVAVVIPTFNAEAFIDRLFSGIAIQSLQADEILVIDSSSKDKTLEKLAQYPCKVHIIPQAEFDHGRTRQLAVEMLDSDIYIFLTQDAIPANEHAFKELIDAFSNPKVGCAYGRQLPHKDSSLFGAHARLFLYPEQSQLRAYGDRDKLGIKTCYNSDSFSAYRKRALTDAGGFPSKIIVSEDTYVVGKMLLKGWLVAYQANATVYHSHNYSLIQELKRYFNVGVFHRSESWIIESFHTPTRMGVGFMRSELQYLFSKRACYLIPLSILRNAAKYIGYKLGLHYEKLPKFLRKSLSGHSNFWQDDSVEVKNSLKLLVYSLNYTPELTGIGKYNTEMCEWLAQRGHTVKVLTAQPYYPDWKVFAGYKAWQYSQQTINGVTVLRCPLWVPKKPNGLKRILHLLTFACSSLPRLLMLRGFKPDIILFIEPSIFCFPNALLASRFLRAKPVLHVQDFEIDVAFNLGMMKSSFLQKCLFRLEAYVYKRCALVSSITPKMRQKLLEKAVAENKAVLFPNWADIESIKPLAHISPLRAELNISDDSIMILYSGNLGAKQGLEIIIESAKALQSKPNILFLICGTGPYLQNLKQMAQDYQLSNILWLPLQPLEKLNNLLNLADIHLLPQKPDVKDQVMPSKLLGMLASGRAIVATALPGTQLYQVMEQTGVVSPPGDVLELVRNLEKLAQDQALRSNLGEKARAYAEQHFSKQHILSCYESQLLKLIKPEGQ